MREMVGGCCVCSDDRGWNENPLVYCDGQSCTVAVHQACYGIVTVPSGPWYCRKCESQERSVKVKCELCPSKYGALKRTENSGWAHVVCALYIPEVRFGNVTTMEPIQLHLIPPERFNKVCYICEENSKTANASVGACMQCNKPGCRQSFHVTCAQSLGLLCEEAGNYLDNVKYCGYCQYHYSKLRKGGNVKAIPAYKPVSTEQHLSDSSSEKEGEAGSSKSSSLTSSTKKKSSSSSGKASSSASTVVKSSNNSTAPSKPTATQKPTSAAPAVAKGVTEKTAKSAGGSAKGVKVEDEASGEVKVEKAKEGETAEGKEGKDAKSGKKRKSSSRTPTPVTLVPNESVVASGGTNSEQSAPVAEVKAEKGEKKEKEVTVASDSEKTKKAKFDLNQSTPASQSAVALTTLTSAPDKLSSPVITLPETPSTATSSSPTPSIIQSTSAQPLTSLVVSVPLASTNLSPKANNGAVVPIVSATPFAHLSQERNSGERSSPGISTMTGGNSNSSTTGVISSEVNSGGLKITFEKQPTASSNLQVELERTPSVATEPAKRTRSQSGEKPEKVGRPKKRNPANNNGNSNSTSQFSNSNNNSTSNLSSKKVIRMQNQQQSTPPPPTLQPQQTPELGAFAAVTQSQLKDSPPSSPSSESQGAPPAPAGRRNKIRKSAPATMSSLKFQNGVHAPHMLGNQLNPNSNMAQKMTDHLNSELEAHSIFSSSDNNSSLIGPQLHHKVIASVRANNASPGTSGGLSTMLGGGSGAMPQSLDQLLERQWEQGSQFLMEQAQHFDIASLLSCLYQLRAENTRLEEHVSSLLLRRDHLLAVNARLAIPLTGQPAQSQSHPHTVNNIHPAVGSHGDVARPSRHSGGGYLTDSQSSSHQNPRMENGLPESGQGYNHRNPVTSQPQPSPTVRHSSTVVYSGLIRQNADTSGRSAPRPQPYPIYQGPGPSTQSQMAMRRESSEMHHHSPSSKPS